MAITITEGNLDASTNTNSCNLSESRQAEVIPFHRHCQKTVCSAWQGGRGLTRTTLMPRNNDDTAFASGDLSNIQSFIFGTPDTWQGYFTRNSNNITEDLRSILELINIIAGKVATKTNWNIAIKDCGGKKIVEPDVTINPWSGGSQTYTFPEIGRFLTLKIDGQPLKFHTIKSGIAGYEAEKLELTFPKNDLTIKFNGVEVDKIENIYMPDDAEVNINQDFNLLPTSGYAGYSGGATVNGTYRIYRHYDSSGGSITPTFVLDSKYKPGSGDSHSPVVQWEFHLRNNNASNILTVNEPVVKVGDDNAYFSRKVALTDQMYVESGKTNVYVFRAEMYSSAKALTYSLAYVY